MEEQRIDVIDVAKKAQEALKEGLPIAAVMGCVVNGTRRSKVSRHRVLLQSKKRGHLFIKGQVIVKVVEEEDMVDALLERRKATC